MEDGATRKVRSWAEPTGWIALPFVASNVGTCCPPLALARCRGATPHGDQYAEVILQDGSRVALDAAGRSIIFELKENALRTWNQRYKKQ